MGPVPAVPTWPTLGTTSKKTHSRWWMWDIAHPSISHYYHQVYHRPCFWSNSPWIFLPNLHRKKSWQTQAINYPQWLSRNGLCRPSIHRWVCGGLRLIGDHRPKILWLVDHKKIHVKTSARSLLVKSIKYIYIYINIYCLTFLWYIHTHTHIHIDIDIDIPLILSC